MWKNNFKIALRNMVKHKSYSFIKIIGLTISMSVCFLLFLWINDELSYDKFHKKADRIYRSQWEAKFGDNSWKTPYVPMPLAETMETQFPEVEKATQVYKGGFTVQKDDEYIRETNVLYVDEKFFDVFTIELLEGAGGTALEHPDAILLTEATTSRYFGENKNYKEVIGQTIKRNDGTLMQVAGVVKSFPSQSHLSFDFLGSLKSLKHLARRKTQWGSATLLTYFLMEENGDPIVLDKKLQAYVDKNIADDSFREGENFTRFPFEKITDIHLKPNLTYIWMFGLIAAFILLLACINFINLATARAMTRAKEVGVRKVLGSKRIQLIGQFFSESFLYVLFAVVLAIVLSEFLLPFFNDFTQKTLSLDFFNTPFLWVLIGGITLFTSLSTGAIPAFVLSAFPPAKAIKGAFESSKGKDRFRQGLVIFQFCISCALIVGTLVINNQLHFLQNRKMGFHKEHVMIVRSAHALRDNFGPFIEKLKNFSSIEKVSSSQYLPGDGFDSTIFVPEQPSNYKETSLSYCHIDEDFVDALKLELVDGRNFDLSFSTDSTACIINETAARRLGWENPIGKNLSYGGYIDSRVVGIVKDFNFSSLHHHIEPLVLRMGSRKLPNIFLRLQPGNLKEQVEKIQNEWSTLAPTTPFEFTFLDEKLKKLYDSEQQMSSVFTIFAILAIFISCLGLFGLATFMAEQRTKEIGIRKVLGASVTSIVTLLSKDFLKLVLIALLIASPMAWYFMDNWLQDFAYRIHIQWWVFAVTGFITIVIALLTISLQSIRAAVQNPVESLKNE